MFDHYYGLTKLQQARHEDMLRRLEQRKLVRFARQQSARATSEDWRPQSSVGTLVQDVRHALAREFKARTRKAVAAEAACEPVC
jgi:hypothetical protein